MITITITPPPNLGYVVPNARKALRDTINDSLEAGQKRGRALLHQRLTIRSGTSSAFLERLIKFENVDRATPEKLNGQMGLQSTGTGTKKKSADLLIKLATGGVFTRPASSPFFIPTTTGFFPLRPTPQSRIPRNMFPSALRLTNTRFAIQDPTKQAKRGARGGIILRGKRRTFAIDPEFHHPINVLTFGIHQRFASVGGGKRDGTSLKWLYRVRVRIPKRYPFIEVVGTYVQEQIPINLQRAIAKYQARANG